MFQEFFKFTIDNVNLLNLNWRKNVPGMFNI